MKASVLAKIRGVFRISVRQGVVLIIVVHVCLIIDTNWPHSIITLLDRGVSDPKGAEFEAPPFKLMRCVAVVTQLEHAKNHCMNRHH